MAASAAAQPATAQRAKVVRGIGISLAVAADVLQDGRSRTCGACCCAPVMVQVVDRSVT
jgi:hypothetical protein